MKKSPLILILFIITFAASVNFAQSENEKIARGGIVNGKAAKLPKPVYSQEAKDFCADGKVEVEVLIGENGDVISAAAISGDELLRDAAVEAVKGAKFRQTADGTPVKTKGIIVYNFAPEQKCIVVGVVNKKALNIPKPKVGNIIHPKHLRISKKETVEVQIMIEIWSGKVLRARAVSGHPLLRAACEASARQSKFSPVNDVPNIPLRATLVYKFKPDGKIEF